MAAALLTLRERERERERKEGGGGEEKGQGESERETGNGITSGRQIRCRDTTSTLYNGHVCVYYYYNYTCTQNHHKFLIILEDDGFLQIQDGTNANCKSLRRDQGS